MVVAAFVIPPLMLCVLVALGRYEEHMLGGDPGAPRHASRRRHLRAVPDEPAPAPAPAASSAAERTGRAA
ncbi:hypothetical protein CUT44_23055 [Streptomyces carminius]|uniref:Uncharacterized protein n=1 Tax=Streptomyces carminius TaxID=2665496 RepID=A0A2M8LU93_9ACTN|nr:hypothetical protein [Streptomyces carminius]PJE95514.1 hypothetical protein CUT44_23055 [Streptomyces carminius]